MRKFVTILFTIFLACLFTNTYAQKDIFIKEFHFELKRKSKNQYENEYFVSVTLNKNSLYKFTMLNHIGDFPGDVVVEILENDKVIATNIVNDKYYEQFAFKCTKTGFYDVLMHYKDDKLGSSLVKLFLVQ